MTEPLILNDNTLSWQVEAPQTKHARTKLGPSRKSFRNEPNPDGRGPPAEAGNESPLSAAQLAQSQLTPLVVDTTASQPRLQPRPRSPRWPGSDGDSLEDRFGHSTLNEHRHGNQSTTHTQKSSLSQKRGGEEMYGPSRSKPFSPSSSRGLASSQLDTNHQSRQSEVLSPSTTSPGIVGHYYNVTSVPHDVPKTVGHTYGLFSPELVPSHENVLVKQPQTRPITEQQLINEVKGIYAGLVMVEKKCVEIVAQQSQSTKKLSDQQWKALVALHRTLLQEHHDFFSASQHPTASDTLKKLAIKYAMPARMWRHGIHAFLELLRHRLPESMEHMLSFIYLSYSMMALLKESVPSFVETWIECLGDLARYRMAIEDTDPRDREIWSNVAKMWYNEAADKSPNVGRIQHHLAVLARPNIVEQLFYYDKALVSVTPFVNARDSIMLLFDMFLKQSDAVQSRYPPTEYAFVNFYAMLFTRRNPGECFKMLALLKGSFGGHMDRAGIRFKMQGPQMASALFAGLLDFGKEDSSLWKMYCQQSEAADARKKAQEGHPDKIAMQEVQHMRSQQEHYWRNLTLDAEVDRIPLPHHVEGQEHLDSSEAVVALAASQAFESITLVASRMGDKNGVPSMHVVLANIWDMSFVPGALPYIEACMPWTAIVLFLNTIGRSGVSYANVEADVFPPSHGGHGRQLPEDFLMRGMMTTRHYYQPDFFAGPLVDEDERTIELPSHQAPRAERCLWLGVRLAKLGRYLTYDFETKLFDTTRFSRSLATRYVYVDT